MNPSKVFSSVWSLLAAIKQLLSTFSRQGVLLYVRLRLMGKELIATGSCDRCGECCRRLNREGKGGWLYAEISQINVYTFVGVFYHPIGDI